MTHTIASVEALLLEAFETNSRECLKEPSIWKVKGHAVKFMTYEKAMHHQINAEIIRALGQQTVHTEALEIDSNIAAKYNTNYTGVVLMNFSNGVRLDAYEKILNEEQRIEMCNQIGPGLFVAGVMSNMRDAHFQNIMMENDKPIIIDTERGIMDREPKPLAVKVMMAQYTKNKKLFPHFHYNFATETIVDAARQARKDFKLTVLASELSNLEKYQPVIEQRYDEIVAGLEKYPDVRTFCQQEFHLTFL